jgi:hypothetical protein
MLRRAIALAAVLSGGAVFGAEIVLDFRQDKLNETPRGFRSTLAGGGQPGEWKIVQDEVPSPMAPVLPTASNRSKRNVLAQLSRDRTDERFPMLLYEGEIFGDFKLTTQFKLVDGAVEQMAGVAFRIQDERNYYYIRASGLGSTFYFYKIVNGQRSPPIGSGKLAIPKGVWHSLAIECKGTQIQAWLNGKEVLPALEDKSFASGFLGFWTKSDAVSYFGDTTIAYKPREILAQTLVNDAFQKYPRLQGLKIYAPAGETGQLKVVASLDSEEVGQTAPQEVGKVLAERGYYYGKRNGEVMLTLPLHDSNGEKVAAVRVVLKSFLGQTENNALARAMPVVKGMETRIQTLKDLTQ